MCSTFMHFRCVLKYVVRGLKKLPSHCLQKLRGLEHMHKNLPLLNQATCLGSTDAMFTLAVFLNNGLGTTVQETEVSSVGATNKIRVTSFEQGNNENQQNLGCLVRKSDAFGAYY